LKFGGKVRLFEKDGAVASGADFTITHLISPLSRCIYINKPNINILDADINLHKEKDITVSLYNNSTLIQNQKARAFSGETSLRFHHQDNKVFGLGVEGYDPVFATTTAPRNITAFGLYGMNKDGVKVFCGPKFAYNLHDKMFAYQKFLVGLKNKNHTAHLEFNSNIKKTVENSVETVSRDNSMALRFDSNLNVAKVGGDLTYQCSKNAIDGRLYASYVVDKSTTLRAKVDTNKALSASVVHNFAGMNVGFITNFQFQSPEGGKKHLKPKFGFIAEIL